MSQAKTVRRPDIGDAAQDMAAKAAEADAKEAAKAASKKSTGGKKTAKK